jgi:hypothetical protein
MYRKLICSIYFLLSSLGLFAQELFPTSEPASNVPKGVLGARLTTATYKEVNLYRNLYSCRLMYGLLSKLTVMANFTETNHHGAEFPAGLAFHTHNGNQSVYGTGNFQRGMDYPYYFTGVDLYAKYRFLTLDGEHSHLRMAVYGEWSNVNVAHDEAEPTLLDDTKGYGGGLIATVLKNHLAISLTTGFIRPGKYDGFSPDIYGGPDVPTTLTYGNAWTYDLSFGYLLLPVHYVNYNKPNLNIYLEFKGKSYGQAQIVQYGVKPVPIQTPLLEAGNFVDVFPGIQTILRSNLRIDFSVGLPLLGQSYAHFYPIYMFGIQRYFYLRKK